MADFFDGLGSALIGGGASLVGGLLRNQSQEQQASAQMAFQREMSNTAYQRQVADLKSAGINPMLAAKLGGASSPPGAQAQIQDAISPAVQAYQQQRMNSAQVANIEADTGNKDAQRELLQAQAAQARASAFQSQAQVEFINQQVKDITSKLQNNYWDSEVDRIRALIANLQHSSDLIAEQSLTEPEKRLNIATMTLHVLEQIKLTRLDVQAAEYLDNLGRTSKELAPIIDLVKFMLRGRK
ncbi:DNA pilot protein [Microviridae sp.]|nr:DNA pilot protein [Microviridae sp.]